MSTVRISYDQLVSEYSRILQKRNMDEVMAKKLAKIFTDMGWEGIYSHGINRFPTFIEQVDRGQVKLDRRPVLARQLGALEQWDCQLGPGPLNGLLCVERAMELARANGVGVVAMRNSNHWMRGGNYALLAARAGFACIASTNSSAVMPPWGGQDLRIGTNPLIIGIPGEEPCLLDMSCSQYSYGALEEARLNGRRLPVEGGYDENGKLSTDPAAIEKTRRLLPAGYWKGSGLSIVLDMLTAFLADGNTTTEITQDIKSESAVSQLLIVFDMQRTIAPDKMLGKIKRMFEFVTSGTPAWEGAKVTFPGYEIKRYIADHESNGGMPINEIVWKKICSL